MGLKELTQDEAKKLNEIGALVAIKLPTEGYPDYSTRARKIADALAPKGAKGYLVINREAAETEVEVKKTVVPLKNEYETWNQHFVRYFG